MKKKIKVMLITLGFLGAFCTGVYAQSYLEQISAYLNKGITLSWNGVPFYPTEEDGSRVYPITYNGRTYIPAKFIAEKAGLNVGWDAETLTVSITDASYVQPTVTNGTYKKIGNGQLKFLTDNFEELTAYGYNVEETLATSNNSTHKARIIWGSGSSYEKRQVHIAYVEELKKQINPQEWKLTSSIPLSDGHYKNVYVHTVQPLQFENYSTDNEIIFLASRTDMNNNSYTNEVVVEGFEGYFSSVPKPSVDSTWVEETQMPLKDWGKNAYTLYKYFKNSNSSKISKEFSEYKNELISKGFKFYEESFDHYTYVKDDISVTIFEGVEHMSVELKSGFQAVHN